MLSILISLIAFLVAISVLVAVHEWGHFWVARRLGIFVSRFSLGFGRPLFRWRDSLGTEFLVSAIPLGGYVSFEGEKSSSSLSNPAEAFGAKPVWVRMAVILAGPVLNLLLAVGLYALLFISGIKTLVPIIGSVPPHSVASVAGLRSGLEILKVGKTPTPSWEAVASQLIVHMGDLKPVDIHLQDITTHQTLTKTLNLSQASLEGFDLNGLEKLGFIPADWVLPELSQVIPNGPADRAGLKAGDLIVSVNGHAIASRRELIAWVRGGAGKPLTLEVKRASSLVFHTLTPLEKKTEEGKTIGFIGVEFLAPAEIPEKWIRLEKTGPIEGLVKAFSKTQEMIGLTLEAFKKMGQGTLSVRQLNGPIVIAKYAGESAMSGIRTFLEFLAKISISIGVLNLLPIPLLDGGHFLYSLYELIRGRPLPQRAQVAGFWIGGTFLVGFMGLAFYNDLAILLR